ncbi:MAG: PAS domain-containing sensor histidine kinase [Gammaproteobacteria bacterium]|nr:PAS domain-containing sensor histidine kinase [Gammaproteobacteria bacterium]
MASLHTATTGNRPLVSPGRPSLRLLDGASVAERDPGQPAAANRLNHLLSILPSGVVVIDGFGLVQECNAVAVGMLGEPLLGLNWLDIIQRAFAPRHDDGHEVSLRDGRRIRIETRALAPEPGQVVVLTDLTETRALQARLNRQERLSTIGRMLASLAHQIRTPLASALIYAGHLRNVELAPSHRERFAERLTERLHHLEQQVRDMLMFARGDSAIVERFSVADLLKRFSQAMELPLSRAEAQLQIEGEDGGAMLIGNPQALLGALQNLAENSLQAMGQGASLSLKVGVEEGRLLVLRFADNGPGIAPALAEQIFEPFYTTKTQGTGLGLAVVKSVMEAHQGQIRLNPARVCGAEFLLELPLAESAFDLTNSLA